ANAFIPASAVAVAGAARKRGRAQTINVRRFFRIAVSGDAIRISETAGLHFIYRRNHGGRRGAAGIQIFQLFFLARALGLVRVSVDVGCLQNWIQLRSFGLDLLNLGLYYFLCDENMW